MISINSLLRSGMVVSCGLAVGRVAGLVRDICISSNYGVGERSDLILILVALPDSVAGVIFAGAIAGTMVPRLGELDAKWSDVFTAQCLIFGLVLSLIVTGGLCLIGPGTVLYPGIADGVSREFNGLVTTVMMISVPLTSFYLVYSARLQAKGIFLSSSLGSAVINIPVIFAIIFWGDIYIVATALLAGVLLRFMIVFGDDKISVSSLGSIFERWYIDWRFLGDYLVLWASACLSAMVPILARSLGSTSMPGTVSIYTYASRLFEVPLGLVISVFGIVLLPKLTCGNRDDRIKIINGSLRAMGVISAGLSGVLMFNADLISGLLFGRNLATSDANQRISSAVIILSFGLPFAGVASVLNAWFIAEKKMWIIVCASVAGVLSFIMVSTLYHGLFGLVFGTLALHIATCLVLMGLFNRSGIKEFIVGIVFSVIFMIPAGIVWFFDWSRIFVAVFSVIGVAIPFGVMLDKTRK